MEKDQIEYTIHSHYSNQANDFSSPHQSSEENKQDIILLQQGYEPQLHRNFSFWSLLGIAFGLTNSWLGIAGSMGETLQSGGPIMVIYGILLALIFVIPVGVTLSEFVSMYPNSGGQFYWTLQLAPITKLRFLLFITGNLSCIGAIFTCSSISLTTLQTIILCYQLSHPDFQSQPWHVYVCCLLIVIFISGFNCFNKPLPYITITLLIMSLTTFFILIITCLAVSHGQYQNASFVFTDPINVDNSMLGITFLVSLTLPTWALAGLDLATHMSEELPDPARTIPKLILSTICIGGLTSFIFSISLFFCIRDVQSVMSAPVPLLEIIYQLLNYNLHGLLLVQSLAIVTAIFCNITANTWQLRIIWSFARDNGLWGSSWWKQINSRSQLPIKAHLFGNFLVLLISLVYLGSSNAYNSIITASLEILYISYVIPTICLLHRKRSNIQHGPFWLNNIGLICNYLTCFWTAFCLIFFSFPYELPLTSGNMNYVSVVYLVCLIYILIDWYIRGSKKFKNLISGE